MRKTATRGKEREDDLLAASRAMTPEQRLKGLLACLRLLFNSIRRVSPIGKQLTLHSSDGDSATIEQAQWGRLPWWPTSNRLADLKAAYDVAALVVYQDADLRGTVCSENSIAKETTVVSVVTASALLRLQL